MSEILLGTQTNAAHGSDEHTCKRVLAGDVEGVRRRLIGALERLDYRLLSEQSPLLAKRAARKGLVASDMLDHARTLAVGLKPSGPAATLATFDFSVMHGLAWSIGRGDRHTLELEADAIVALANMTDVSGPCPACGTENSGDARFCRSCGAPRLHDEPAELELARLDAGARASYLEIIIGIIIIFAQLALMLPLILYSASKGASANVWWFLLATGQLFGWWMTLYGVRRLRRALNPKDSAGDPSKFAQAQAMPARRVAAELPPAAARASVTEGTTELLGVEPRERVAVPLRRKGGDTDPS